jgi:hypothetical protein
MIDRNILENVALCVEISIPLIKDYPVHNFRTVTGINMKF